MPNEQRCHYCNGTSGFHVRGCSYPEGVLSELEPTAPEGASPPAGQSTESEITATVDEINAASRIVWYTRDDVLDGTRRSDMRPPPADHTGLAGVPLVPTVESVNAVIRQVHGLESESDQRQMRRDIQNSMYGLGGSPQGSALPIDWVALERGLSVRYDWPESAVTNVPADLSNQRPAMSAGGITGCTGVFTDGPNQHVLPHGTKPEKLASEEARLLRAMNKV